MKTGNENIKIDVPAQVCEILNKLNEAGYEAYAVGGCVRDSLLGKQPADWDITTSARPEQVKSIFRHTVDTGIQHGTVTVLMRDNGVISGYEVTTYRIDGIYEDSRHPKEVTFTPELSEDLKRRDFTVNAMAYHPGHGLIDLFGGQEDLERKLIRCVGNAKERFTEDALRMMRAIRFAAQLGGTIEDETYAAISELAPTLARVSAERIRVEVEKLLVSAHPYYFKMFYETGLTAVFLPEFDKCMKTTQENPHHCYSVGEHLLHSTETIDIERLRNETDKEDYSSSLKILRLTMLLHDIGKSELKTVDGNGIAHFKGHPELGAKMAEEILKRLKYDNDTIHMVKGLVLGHEGRYPAEKKYIRRDINRLGTEYFPLMFYVNEADMMAQSDFLRDEKKARLERLRALYLEIKAADECLSLSDLAVKGADLIAAGVKPGPGMGKILNAMLSDVLDDPTHNDRDYLMTNYVK
ncbi:MAG: HD domain-containing protein [Lachnospiraceae bacterium]|nr:HD domain-containing protein [Lachnospiraceae bacterium]